MRLALCSLAIAGGSVACTFITNETSTQCRTQDDCLARGPDFADTTCSADRVCVKIAISDKACTTHKECIDANGGAPYICRKSDGKCVSLLTSTCQTVYYDKEDLLDINNDAVVIGTTLPFDENGRQAGFAADLARYEIKREGGLPPTPEGKGRPLVLVSCVGEHSSLASGLSMFNHLAKEVQVPYVSGPFTSQLMTRGLDIFTANNVMAMTQNSMIDILNYADSGLIFRVNFGDDLFVQTLDKFIHNYLEDSVRKDTFCAHHPMVPQPGGAPPAPCVPFNLGPTEPLKVGLMVTVDQPGQAVQAAIGKYMTFNGKSVTDNIADGNFKIFNVGNPADPIGHPYPEAERAQGIQDAIAFKPHIIMYVGTPIDANILGGDLGWLALNRAWPAGVPRPYGAMVIAGWAGPVVPLVAQSGALGPESRWKFFGMRGLAYNWSPVEFGGWVTDLKTKYQELAGANVVPLAAMSYDRMYLFSYAAAALGNAPLKGTELGRALRNNVAASGQPINHGSPDYKKALGLLAAGNHLAYHGVDGDYTFDARGARPGYGDVYCIPTYNIKGTPTIKGPQTAGFTWDPNGDKVKIVPDATKLPQTIYPAQDNLGSCADVVCTGDNTKDPPPCFQ